MFFIVLLLILAICYSLLFCLTGLFGWFILLWIFLGILCSALSVALFGILFLLIGSKTKPNSRFKHFILWNACFIGIKFLHLHVEVVGKENIPKGPFVVYSNHKSQMDPVMIYHAMHVICSAVGKKSLFVNPIMALVAKCYAAVPLDRDNDREAIKSINYAISLVKEGIPMIIFPEGGIRTRETDEMHDLRPGAYKLALKSMAPILPVSIIGSSKIKGKKRTKRLDVKIIFHELIPYAEFQNMKTVELGPMVEDIINKGIRDEKK